MSGGASSLRDDALARERRLWNAYVSADRGALEASMDARARYAGPRGIRSRDEVIDAVSAMRIEGFEFREFELTAVSPDVEIVTYLAIVAGTYRGVPFDAGIVVSTSVWTRSHESWKLVHRCEFPANPAVVRGQEPAD